MPSYTTKYRPIKKGSVKRLTLYGYLDKCLDTGKVGDYDEFVNHLITEKDIETVKNLVTDMIRDHLFEKFDYNLFVTKKKEL